MSTEIKNAVIESAGLSTADRGLLSSWIMLDYGGAGQGFGGFALYLPKSWRHHKHNCGFAGHWIFRCMEIAGVEDWDKMKGKTIRVKVVDGTIKSIGHIIKDDWFTPSEDFNNE